MFALRFERSTEQDTFSGGYGEGGHIKGEGEDRRSIIFRLPATTADYRDPNRQAVYASSEAGVQTCPNDKPREPVYVLAQYYLKDNTVYKRTLVPALDNICGSVTIFQKQTDGTSAQPDMRIADGIAKLRVEYYADDTMESVESDAYIDEDEPLPESVVSARVTLESTSSGDGQPAETKTILNRGAWR